MSIAAGQQGGRQQSWLEHMPRGGGPVQRTPLDSDKLTIGRCESADLQIDSTRVSREHARIEVVGDKVLLRDLGSTNGTFVNGARVEEIELQDGDVIVVADTDVTFLTNATSRLRRMATQPLPSAAEEGAAQLQIGEQTRSNIQTERDAIHATRAAHEQITQRVAAVRLAPIVDVVGHRVFAQVAAEWEAARAVSPTSPFSAAPSHVAKRRLELLRESAVQRCAAMHTCSHLVLPVESWEIGDSRTILWHFEELRLGAPSDLRLIASVKAAEAVDLTETGKFCRDLRAVEVGVALTDFIGTAAHIADFPTPTPDLLFLGSELTSDLANRPRVMRQLPSIIEACRQADILLVAGTLSDRETMDCLTDEGVRLFLDRDNCADEILRQSDARDQAFAAVD